MPWEKPKIEENVTKANKAFFENFVEGVETRVLSESQLPSSVVSGSALGLTSVQPAQQGVTLGTSSLVGETLEASFTTPWGIKKSNGQPYYDPINGPAPGDTPAVLLITSTGQPAIVGVQGAH